MKYKIIVIDVFNTLLNNKYELTEENRNALLYIQKELGIRVVLTSGRTVAALKPLAEELNLREYSGYLIPYHGGQIVNCRSGKVIASHRMATSFVDVLDARARAEGVTLLAFGRDSIFSTDPHDPLAVKESDICGQPLVSKHPRSSEVIKCSFVGEAEKIAELEVVMRRDYGDKLNVFRSSETLLECLPSEVQKIKAISDLLDKLDLSREELVSVGDSYCDVEMIQLAGLGVAVANAREAVKACADYITTSNEENGVAHLVDKYIRHEYEAVPFSVEDVNSIVPGTLMESLGIRCTKIARGYVEATMPVDIRTRQPMGILHGGASLAFAETLAGFGSVALCNPGEIQVGLQVSGNHVSSALEGDVLRGEASIMHQGRSTHVWSINIYSTKSGKLICTCRVLNSILKQR
ncbi:HAD-IIB family hydrolase [Porphyromonas gulae]|uniref:HAD-IIB family hydrolase n=1 Tax=Porphyromonas gulae TaxID=111105 RepID=UPI00051E0911|nr:HAD-IIB family hydrolase [Porphyromonas gulae]KGL47418.1 haloacid dehalogenase [Porphyromonas gulae]